MGNGHQKAFKTHNNLWVVTNLNTYPLTTSYNIEYVDKKNINLTIGNSFLVLLKFKEHHGHHHDKVSLKNGHGKYIRVSGNKIELSDKADDDTVFHVESHDGKYALRTHAGTYITVSDVNSIIVTKDRNAKSLYVEHKTV